MVLRGTSSGPRHQAGCIYCLHDHNKSMTPFLVTSYRRAFCSCTGTALGSRLLSCTCQARKVQSIACVCSYVLAKQAVRQYHQLPCYAWHLCRSGCKSLGGLKRHAPQRWLKGTTSVALCKAVSRRSLCSASGLQSN